MTNPTSSFRFLPRQLGAAVSLLALISATGVACSSSDADDSLAHGGSAGSSGSAGHGGTGGGGGTAGASAGTSGSGGTGGAQVEQAHSSKSRDTAPSLSDSDKATAVSDLNAFSMDLYAKASASKAGQNVVMSPLSVSLALSMTLAGANGATQSEMIHGLHSSFSAAQLATANDWLTLELAKRPAQALADSHQTSASPVTMDLNVVNSLWGEKTLVFKQPFLDTMAVDYGTGVNLLDFVNESGAARVAINDWVSDETSQRIKDLLPPPAVTDDTRLVLVNAINLSAPWQTPFESSQTSDSMFHLLDGSSASSTFMHQQSDMSYVENTQLQAAQIPLLGNAFSLVVIAPKGDFSAYESSIDGPALDQLFGSMQSTTVDLAFPKCKVSGASVSLSEPLKALGMNTMFSNADLTGIADEYVDHQHASLFVSDVFHQAMMGFDEKGVQAAAATAVVVNDGAGGGIPNSPVPFSVDRPFLVGIRDVRTGALLFWGRIVNPT